MSPRWLGVLIAGLLVGAAPTASWAAGSWDLAADFRASPNHANPNPDSLGNAAVWYFLGTPTLDRDPANHVLLPEHVTDRFDTAGLESWQADQGDESAVRTPNVALNTRDDNPHPLGVDWPAGTVLAHPGPQQLAIVGWKSPVSGLVDISGTLIDRHSDCGDGLDWWVDRGTTALASGSVPFGGSASFGGPGSPLRSRIAVGEFVYVSLGPAGAYACDSTGLSVSVVELTAGETMTEAGASPDGSVFGQPVTFTATVSGTDPAEPPSGSIQLKENGAALGAPVALDGDGTANVTVSSLDVGDHTVVAEYQPGASGSQASEATVLHTVEKASTTTQLAVSPDQTVAGQDATFTATVRPVAPGAGTPAGSVQFTEADGAPIGPPEPVDDSGRAIIVASAGAGSYEVRANYLGDSYFAASAGSAPQQVGRADTTTHITSSRNPVPVGGDVTWTVLVDVVPPGDVEVFGSVQLSIDGTLVGDPIALAGAGGFQLDLTAPSVPQTNRIGVSYSGDQDTNASSAELQQTVAAAPVAVPPSVAAPPSATAPLAASSLRAMTSGLQRALARRGFAALTRTTQRLTVPQPGLLLQRVYSPRVPKSATGSKVRNVLIAGASRRFRAAGTGALRLKLTAAGRRKVRRAKSLRLAIVTRFAPLGGLPVVAVQRITVKAKPKRSAARTAGGWRVDAVRAER